MNRRKSGKSYLGMGCMAFLATLSGQPVSAEEIGDTTGLADYIAGSTDVQVLKDYGITWGGWLNASVTANANNPADGFNGPVTMADRAGELQMNQLYGYLQRAVTVSGDAWDFGGRFDITYGTDSIFTQAYGVPAFDPRSGQPLNRGNYDLHLTSWSDRFYGLALPQAYLEMNLPVGNGLSVKAGHFYTIIGYEVVTAPDNFFLTHAYTMQYGEPFTHTGLLGTYAFDENWTASAGAVTGSATGGWDGNFNTQLSNWNFLGGVTWTSDDKDYSMNLSSTAGARSANASTAWAMYSLVGKANFLDSTLHYVIQHDHGYADDVITGNGLTNLGNGTAASATQNAEWYGINQYLTYDVLDNLGVGVRAEWFRDNNGFRIWGPGRCGASINANTEGVGVPYACNINNLNSYPWAGANYYALTAGLNYKPVKWINLRPNFRYDWSSQETFMSATPGKQLDNQFTFSADIVITF
ncbi:MAG: porin [Methylococcaceae bacterium]|jgi:hypothetical protein|nr:porin [Methylococcaceae bacterium]